MARSFFEMLGIADKERIHTQILAWLLSSESPLGNERIKLINGVFGENVAEAEELAGIVVATELDRLDLVLICTGKWMIAVENKMKSRQGGDQLKRYNETINKLCIKFEVKDEKCRKFFLTFAAETCQQIGWIDIDYQNIFETLKSTTTGLNSPCIAEYMSYLEQLLIYRSTFLLDHIHHQEVFLRSGMKSLDRLLTPLANGTPLENFVYANRMERIFVEALLRKILGNLLGTSESPSAFVGESKGVALVHINLFVFSFNSAKEREFRAGLQFQGKTLKLNVGAVDYDNSHPDWLSKVDCTKIDQAMENFLIKKTTSQKWRMNPARTRAYRSWSSNKGKRIEETSLNDFANWLETQVKWACNVWGGVLNDLQNQKVIGHISRLTSFSNIQPSPASEALTPFTNQDTKTGN